MIGEQSSEQDVEVGDQPNVSQQREEILQTLARHRDSIQRFGARRLGLFGSQARGEAAEGSDLDFLVEFEPGTKSFDNYMDLK